MRSWWTLNGGFGFPEFTVTQKRKRTSEEMVRGTATEEKQEMRRDRAERSQLLRSASPGLIFLGGARKATPQGSTQKHKLPLVQV